MNTESKPVVVAVGELLWDVFPDGARFGGAPGNFAHHAAALGAETYMVSSVGDDELGHQALDRLRHSGIDVRHVAVNGTAPTGTVDVQIDDRGHASYHFHRDEAWDRIEISSELQSLVQRCDAICFGSLGQRSDRSRDTIQQLVAATPVRTMRMFDINLRPPFVTAPVIDRSLQLANALKLNDEELQFLVERYSLGGDGQQQQAEALVERFELRLLALTRGPDGALLVTPEQSVAIRGAAVEVVDTVGAGDSFTAAVVIGILRGRELALVGAAACRIAEYVCTQAGATPAMPRTVLTDH